MSVDPQGHTHPERPAAEDPTAGGGAATAAQALLSSDLSESLNRLAASALAGPATIYDKALDANYLNPLLRPDLGGNYHRLFDGGHTIAGAAKAVHAATPDDTIIEEALGTVGGLLKDAVTPRGLPIRTWDKASFDTTAAALGDRFGIPKSWLYDINTYDVADVCAAAVGTVAVIFGWNRADTETFAQITASAGVSAVAAANPLLMMVTVAALARAFHKARRGDDYTALLDGGVKGAVGSATMLAAVAAVGAAGGSAGIGLLAGVTAGVLAHKATKHVTLSAVGRFVVDAARDMADRAQFELLADAWYADTMVSSSSTEMYGHDAYRQIIAHGRDRSAADPRRDAGRAPALGSGVDRDHRRGPPMPRPVHRRRLPRPGSPGHMIRGSRRTVHSTAARLTRDSRRDSRSPKLSAARAARQLPRRQSVSLRLRPQRVGPLPQPVQQQAAPPRRPPVGWRLQCMRPDRRQLQSDMPLGGPPRQQPGI